ncbi:MAG: hypothetical protein JKY27_03730 [Magnetovibrio sp.]|nr:hypothetical protein [Magnetovibrio sp.]
MLSRRLSDKIIAAHEVACDEDKREIASFLLGALEYDLSSIGGDQEEHRRWSQQMENAFARHEKAFHTLQKA